MFEKVSIRILLYSTLDTSIHTSTYGTFGTFGKHHWSESNFGGFTALELNTYEYIRTNIFTFLFFVLCLLIDES